MRGRLVAAALAGFWLTSAVGALPPVDQGTKAWKRSDYREARTLWLQASQAGDARAMYLYSQLLEHGQGGEIDLESALTWLRASAEGGYAPAQYNLGNHYQQGDGLTQDLKLAAHWWRQAALQGLAPAQYNLGTLYYRGLGLPRDLAQARVWYQQAASNGSARAAKMLAVIDKDQARAVPEAPQPADKPQAVRQQQVPAEDEADRADGPAQDMMAAGIGAVLPSAQLPESLAGLALGPDWLARQPADHYTLQLLATRKLGAVRQFLQQHRFNRQVAVFPFTRGEQDWYAVLYGRFATPDEARSSTSDLPGGLRGNAPWVRRLAEFQPATQP